MRDPEFRIEFNGAFEPFDRLAQTFSGAARRVITSGGVKLAGFLVLAGLRVSRRHQDLRRYWRDTIFVPAFFRSRGLLRGLAIQRRMSQVAQNALERRLPPQRIELRLYSQPHHPTIVNRVRLEQQFQGSLALAEMQVNQRKLIRRDVTVN